MWYFCPASGIARSPPVRVPGSCAPLERYRRRVDYRVIRSSVIRGIGSRVSPIIPITVGRSRRERLAPRTFRLRRASARSHVASRSTPLALGDRGGGGPCRGRRTPNDGSPHAQRAVKSARRDRENVAKRIFRGGLSVCHPADATTPGVASWSERCLNLVGPPRGDRG